MQYELDYVCRHMLDNADMNLDLSAYPYIAMGFVVYGSVDAKFWGVKFDCIGAIEFAIRNESDISRDELHVVLGVSVTQIELSNYDEDYRQSLPTNFDGDRIWSVTIEGHATIQLVCREFKWSLQELDPQAYE